MNKAVPIRKMCVRVNEQMETTDMEKARLCREENWPIQYFHSMNEGMNEFIYENEAQLQ